MKIIKIALLAIIVCCSHNVAIAQEAASGQKHTIKVEIQDPEFPGGQKALFAFLSKQMKYPPKALAAKKEGRAVVKFMVNADGSIVNITALSKDNDGFATEAIRIVKRMPNWIPAKQDGNPVKMYYSLPVNFKLKK